jgi:hypothetical protein
MQEPYSAFVGIMLKTEDWIMALLQLRQFDLQPKKLLFIEIKLFCTVESNDCYVTLIYEKLNRTSDRKE